MKDKFGNHRCSANECHYKLGTVVTFNNAFDVLSHYEPVTCLLANYGEFKYIDDIEGDCGGLNDYLATSLCMTYGDQHHIATREEVDKWNKNKLNKLNLNWNYDKNEMEFINGIVSYEDWENNL